MKYGGILKSIGILISTLALVVALVPMVIALKVIGSMRFGSIAKGLIGLAGMMVALLSFMKIASKMKPMGFKQVLSTFVSMIGLAVLVGAFALALDAVKDADTDKIVAFSGGLSALMVALGVFMKLTGSVGLVGVGTSLLAIIGVVAVIGLIIAAFAGLSKVPGFQEFMNSGAESIGEIIGSFMGALKAAEIKSMAKGLSGLSDVSVDENGLENVLRCAQMISDFASGLPEKSIVSKITDFFVGSELEQFANGMVVFGDCAKQLSKSMNGVVFDQTAVDAAINVANGIISLQNALPEETIGDRILNFFGDTQLEQFANGMIVFGDCAKQLSKSMNGVTFDQAAVDAAISVANGIVSLQNALPEETIGDRILNFFGDTQLEQFANGMVVFGDCAKQLSKSMNGVVFDQTAVDAAVSAANAIADIATRFEPVTIDETLANMFAGGSPFEKFCGSMETYANAVKEFAKGVGGLSETDIGDDTTTAINATTHISEFMEKLAGMEIETSKNKIATFFTGDTTANSLFDQMTSLAESIKDMGEKIHNISETTIIADVESAMTCMEAIVRLLAWISSSEVEINTSHGVDVSTDNSAFTNIMRQMSALSTNINDFTNQTENVDIERFRSIMDTIKLLTDSLSTISATVSTDAMSSLTTTIADLTSFFSGTGENAIDTSDWLSGLDAEGLATTLSNFTSTVGESMGTATDSLSGYAESFNQSGTAMVSALTSGMSDSSVDTSGMITIVKTCLDSANSYIPNFKTAGKNMSIGMSVGIHSGKSLVVNAAIAVASAGLKAAQEKLDINSPSREFEKLGMFADQGLAYGFERYAKVVTKSASGIGDSALKSAKGSLTNLANIISDDFDADPVVRPVVDLSNVSAGARAIGGMLGGGHSISVGATASKAAATANSIARTKARQNQNGGSSSDTSPAYTADERVDIHDNIFQVRDDRDIALIGKEIATQTHREQRSYGAKPRI